MAIDDTPREQLREHLRFYAELGANGVSRDPEWRDRAADRAEVPPEARAGTTEATETVEELPAASGTATPSLFEPGPPAVVRQPSRANETLDDIRTEIGPDCSRCKLHRLGRTQVVYGVGNPQAQLMFIGEAPGQDEDIQGIPFVGKAGQLLTKIIEAINLKRDDVYIANVIKCRPPDNRNPEQDEVDACEPFLFRQVQIINPRVIVALGKFAAQALLRTTDPISRLRGRQFRYGSAVLIPTFHPAYLLRSPSSKREVWEDMKKVRDLLAAAKGHEG
jgi:DNA polymerase